MEARLRELWAMDAIDMPTIKIARELRISPTTLYKLANQYELGSRPKRLAVWNAGQVKLIDVPLLYRLWHSDPREVSTTEIARQLGVSASTLYKYAELHKLSKRERVYRDLTVDPTPEEIEQRAAECREKHFKKRRRESEEQTRSRVAKEDQVWHQTSSHSQA